MKCVCQRCYEVIDLKCPKYDGMSDSFWGGECPKCGYYGPMYKLYDFVKLRDKLNSVEINMKKYLVRFTTKSGDNDKEWCYAENKHQAAQQMRDEHWNIKSIDLVTEL